MSASSPTPLADPIESMRRVAAGWAAAIGKHLIAADCGVCAIGTRERCEVYAQLVAEHDRAFEALERARGGVA